MDCENDEMHRRNIHDNNEIERSSTASNNSELSDNKLSNKKSIPFNFAITNTRSLLPKIASFVKAFEELGLTLCIVTELWLKQGKYLNECCQDLENGSNILLIHRSRKSRRGQNEGGGDVIAYDEIKITLKEYPIRRGKNSDNLLTSRRTNGGKKSPPPI